MTERRADLLHDAIEDEILTGRLPPGTRLDETSLSARFGVSRTPIREALMQLSVSGLIELRPRRGAIVAEVGPRRMMEMFEVMAELEAMCARLAARRAGPQDLDAIREAHQRCAEAASEQDENAYYYENEAFHEAIDAACRQEFLSEQTRALRKRLKPYRRMQLQVRDRVRNSFAEHQEVVEAIAAGDPEGAAAAMRDHISVQGERFADLIASLDRARLAAER